MATRKKTATVKKPSKSANGAVPTTGVIREPFEVPFEWQPMHGSQFVSRDGEIRIRVTPRIEGGFHLEGDFGSWRDKAGAQQIGALVMRLMTGADGNTRQFNRLNFDPLIMLLDNWDLIDADALRMQVSRMIAGLEPAEEFPGRDLMDEREDEDGGTDE